MSPLAEALKPYLLYLIYALIMMLSLTLLVGGLLILQRIWKRGSQRGELTLESDRVAAEINEEIQRLEDLRDRLDPSYATQESKNRTQKVLNAASKAAGVEMSDGDADENSDDPSVEGSKEKIKTVADLASEGGGSAEEIAARSAANAALLDENSAEFKARVDAVVKSRIQDEVMKESTRLMAEVADLNDKLADASREVAAAKETLASKGEGGAASSSSNEELEALKAKLEDYQAFEEEIALAKTYKKENEELRERLGELEAGGAVAASSDAGPAGATAGAAAPRAKMPTAASLARAAPAMPKIPVVPKDPSEDESHELPITSSALAGSGSEISEEDIAKLFAEMESLQDADFDETDMNKPVQSAAPIEEAQMKEPRLPEQLDEETAEALAELNAEDDLMAEFEKLLTTPAEKEPV